MDEYNNSTFIDDVFMIGTGGIKLKETGEQVQVTDTIARGAKNPSGLFSKKTMGTALMPDVQDIALGQTQLKGFNAMVANAFRSLASEIPVDRTKLVAVYPRGGTVGELVDELGVDATHLTAYNLDNTEAQDGKILITAEDYARLEEAGYEFPPAPESIMQGSIGLDIERD